MPAHIQESVDIHFLIARQQEGKAGQITGHKAASLRQLRAVRGYQRQRAENVALFGCKTRAGHVTRNRRLVHNLIEIKEFAVFKAVQFFKEGDFCCAFHDSYPSKLTNR